MRLLLKKSGDELVQRIKDERYIATYLTDKDDVNYFATVTIPCFFGNNTNYRYQLKVNMSIVKILIIFLLSIHINQTNYYSFAWYRAFYCLLYSPR